MKPAYPRLECLTSCNGKLSYTELGLILIENSDISVFHQDDMGRDALDIAFICSNNALGDLIYDKWNMERALKIANKKEGTTSIQPTDQNSTPISNAHLILTEDYQVHSIKSAKPDDSSFTIQSHLNLMLC